MSDLPIACDLSAAERAQRSDQLLPGLVARAVERSPLNNGYRWRFVPTAQLLHDVARVIETERSCCRFLHFRVDVDPGGGPIWLEVTGPDGTADFLTALISG